MAVPGRPLRIATYNVEEGGDARADLLVEVLRACNPHIALLNEAGDRAVIERLAAALGMTHVWARGSGDKNIALLSYFPILRSRIHNRRPVTQALLEVEISIRPDLSLTIYGAHLLPYFMLVPYELARWLAVRAILRHIRAQPPALHILLGDFNAVAPGDPADLSPFPPRVQRLVNLQARRFPRLALGQILGAGYVDCYRRIHPTLAGFTWMPERPSARLDYFFAPSSLARRLSACDVWTASPAARASDHFPLWAEFEIGSLT